MARLQQTQRKRVGSIPRLPDDVVAAIAAEVKGEFEARDETMAKSWIDPIKAHLQTGWLPSDVVDEKKLLDEARLALEEVHEEACPCSKQPPEMLTSTNSPIPFATACVVKGTWEATEGAGVVDRKIAVSHELTGLFQERSKPGKKDELMNMHTVEGHKKGLDITTIIGRLKKVYFCLEPRKKSS
ncbi:hypothetical protein AgCh_012414 [Apium graveolens]